MPTVLFKYQEDPEHLGDLTTVEINCEIWFVATDVCSLSGIENVSVTLLSLEDDEKLLSEIPRIGQKRKVNLINENGLYTLLPTKLLYKPNAFC